VNGDGSAFYLSSGSNQFYWVDNRGSSFPVPINLTAGQGTANGTPGGGTWSYTYYAGSTAGGTPLPGTPTTAGTYTVVATLASSDTDYNNATIQETFTIAPAAPTLSVIDNGGTFNGQPFPATATATGGAGTAVSGTFSYTYYSGSSAGGTGSANAPTDAGTYTVVASFTSADPNYSNGSAQATFSIGLTHNQAFVTAAYQDILGRLPIPGELENWSALLDRGASPAALSMTLAHGAEYYGNVVSAAYQKYLGRAALPAEVQAWVGLMQHGLTDERLEAGFIGSREYIQDHGGQGAGWVSGMYQDLLGRTPQQAEVDAWVQALAAGMSPTQVAYGFAASAEREAQRITADYQKYVGRTPTAAEISAWVNAFENGFTNEDVIAGFVGSPEYYQKHA
jgi:hypothetical protein